MTAAQYDFTIEQGTDFHKSFSWKNPDNTPIDLTGYSAKCQVRDKARNILIDFNTAGTVTIDGANGKVTLTLPNAVTSALTFDIALYDLKLTSTLSTKIRLVQGRVKLSKQETV